MTFDLVQKADWKDRRFACWGEWDAVGACWTEGTHLQAALGGGQVKHGAAEPLLATRLPAWE